MEYDAIIKEMHEYANTEAAAGMARFGIQGEQILGISIPTLRSIAKKTKNNHILALKLWKSPIHEAKILASMIDSPELVTDDQLESWVNDFASWDICDQTCNNLFRKTSFAYQKAHAWCEREKEFVRRAGFVLMATLAVGDKQADDASFEAFFPLICKHAIDHRNFVKKAVNWALRQIGKRNKHLHAQAILIAQSLESHPSASARWIAKDALRELKSPKIIARIQ